MRYLDVTQILGGDTMTSSCVLSKAGIGYRVSALIDTGANGYAFIDQSLLKLLTRMLVPFIQSLPHSIPIKGYNGISGQPITHFVHLILTIDHRIQSFTPFLITNHGNNGIILGRKLLAQHGVLPDCTNKRLIWPSLYPPTYNCARQIMIQLRDEPKINYRHQRAADRRDALFAQEDIKIKKLTKKTIQPLSATLNSTGKNLQIDTANIINTKKTVNVNRKPLVTIRSQQRSIYTPDPSLNSTQKNSVDIAAISGPALHLNGRRHDNEFFTSSLYEIDALVSEKLQDQRSQKTKSAIAVIAEIHQIKHSTILAPLKKIDDNLKIPQEFSDFADVFSKAESDILPPHRSYDHKIILEGDGEKGLKYSPLYRMSLNELETVKKWIVDNLSKGFIEPSQAPFAAPILFVKKADGNLRL